MRPCIWQAVGFDSHACQQVYRWDRVQALLEAEAIGVEAEAVDEIAASISLVKRYVLEHVTRIGCLQFSSNS